MKKASHPTGLVLEESPTQLSRGNVSILPVSAHRVNVSEAIAMSSDDAV